MSFLKEVENKCLKYDEDTYSEEDLEEVFSILTGECGLEEYETLEAIKEWFVSGYNYIPIVDEICTASGNYDNRYCITLKEFLELYDKYKNGPSFTIGLWYQHKVTKVVMICKGEGKFSGLGKNNEWVDSAPTPARGSDWDSIDSNDALVLLLEYAKKKYTKGTFFTGLNGEKKYSAGCLSIRNGAIVSSVAGTPTKVFSGVSWCSVVGNVKDTFNKWCKTTDGEYLCVKSEHECYGFDRDGEWVRAHSAKRLTLENYTLATSNTDINAIKSKLLSRAEELYPVGTKYKCALSVDNEVIVGGDFNIYDQLLEHITDGYGGSVYHKGKWATVVEKPGYNFEEGKVYSANRDYVGTNYKMVFKVCSCAVAGNILCDWRYHFKTKEFCVNSGAYVISELSDIKELKQSEFNKLLPDGHCDKIEVGSWVVGWHNEVTKYSKNAWQVMKSGSDYLSPEPEYSTSINYVRLATPDEITGENSDEDPEEIKFVRCLKDYFDFTKGKCYTWPNPVSNSGRESSIGALCCDDWEFEPITIAEYHQYMVLVGEAGIELKDPFAASRQPSILDKLDDNLAELGVQKIPATPEMLDFGGVEDEVIGKQELIKRHFEDPPIEDRISTKFANTEVIEEPMSSIKSEQKLLTDLDWDNIPERYEGLDIPRGQFKPVTLEAVCNRGGGCGEYILGSDCEGIECRRCIWDRGNTEQRTSLLNSLTSSSEGIQLREPEEPISFF